MQLWALVIPAIDDVEERTFELYGTGHPIKNPGDVGYIESFMPDDGKLIFHLFERS